MKVLQVGSSYEGLSDPAATHRGETSSFQLRHNYQLDEQIEQ